MRIAEIRAAIAKHEAAEAELLRDAALAHDVLLVTELAAEAYDHRVAAETLADRLPR